MSSTMGKDHLAREQERLDRVQDRRITRPGLAALVLGLVSFVVQTVSITLLWPSVLFSLVLVALIVWTSVALKQTTGHRTSARAIGIVGIAVAGLGILQSLGFLLAMALLAGAV